MTAYRFIKSAESLRRVVYSSAVGFVVVFILFAVTR